MTMAAPLLVVHTGQCSQGKGVRQLSLGGRRLAGRRTMHGQVEACRYGGGQEGMMRGWSWADEGSWSLPVQGGATLASQLNLK